MPANIAGFEKCRDDFLLLRLASHCAQSTSIGKANITRQKALANAPTSASRTNTGEKPMIRPPTKSALNAVGNESCA